MPRYIDAEKIEIKVERGINDDGLVFIPMRDVHRSIDRTPTADVVEVVRCKDCEYFYKPHEQSFSCYCTHVQWAEYADGNGMRVSGIDFCSYGERRNTDGSEGH